MKRRLAGSALALGAFGFLPMQCAPDPTYHAPNCNQPDYGLSPNGQNYSCKFSRQFEIEAGTPMVGVRILCVTPAGYFWHDGAVNNIANQGAAEMTMMATCSPYGAAGGTPIERPS